MFPSSEVQLFVPLSTLVLIDFSLPCGIFDSSRSAAVLSSEVCKLGKIVFFVFNKCNKLLNDCRICSLIFAAGIGIYCGINFTVSEITSVLVVGM